MQPRDGRRGDAGIDIDEIGLGQAEFCGVAANDFDIPEPFQILPRASRQMLFNFAGGDAAAGRRQPEQDRRIVSQTGADPADQIASLWQNGAQPCRVQKRLAIVDRLAFVERDKAVLIDLGRVGAGGLQPAIAQADPPDPPRAGRQKIFAPHRSKCALKPLIAGFAGQCHLLGKEKSDFS